MIRQLTEQDRPFLEGLTGLHWSTLRIRALTKAYGFGYSFLRFFGDEEYKLAICIQDGFAVLWIADGEESFRKKKAAEAAEFLPMAADYLLSELPLEGITEEFEPTEGYTFVCREYPPKELEGITENVQVAFPILSRVFPESVNQKCYLQWYADHSHRIRHGMSRVFTLDGVCTGTCYACEDGFLGVNQLATLPEHRKEGWAKAMLSHMTFAVRPEKGILLQSQNPESDRFYERLGFLPVEKWYSYERKKENPS